VCVCAEFLCISSPISHTGKPLPRSAAACVKSWQQRALTISKLLPLLKVSCAGRMGGISAFSRPLKYLHARQPEQAETRLTLQISHPSTTPSQPPSTASRRSCTAPKTPPPPAWPPRRRSWRSSRPSWRSCWRKPMLQRSRYRRRRLLATRRALLCRSASPHWSRQRQARYVCARQSAPP